MKQFTEEDLVTVYFASYESSGDVWMLFTFDKDMLYKYEKEKSCGELGSIYTAEILKDSRLYYEAKESHDNILEYLGDLDD